MVAAPFDQEVVIITGNSVNYDCFELILFFSWISGTNGYQESRGFAFEAFELGKVKNGALLSIARLLIEMLPP